MDEDQKFGHKNKALFLKKQTNKRNKLKTKIGEKYISKEKQRKKNWKTKCNPVIIDTFSLFLTASESQGPKYYLLLFIIHTN